jgi:Ca-activated chloride channel family protein
MFSDGEETGGPDVEAAALLAADAGVRIETVGIGTAQGAIVEVDGFQVATALNDQMLAGIAEITGGRYHPAQDTGSLNDVSSAIDLRVTFKEEPVELTAILAALSILLLTIGGLMMTRMHGRIV